MDLVLHIPDDLAASLGESGDVERQALEALAVESYRADRLSKAELRRMLGLRTRFEVDAFLKAHDVFTSRSNWMMSSARSGICNASAFERSCKSSSRIRGR